jgi:hypothetical protein
MEHLTHKTQDEESRCVAHLCSSLYCVALFVLDSSSCVLPFTSGSRTKSRGQAKQHNTENYTGERFVCPRLFVLCLTLHKWVCVAHLCSSLYCVALFVLDSSSCVFPFTSNTIQRTTQMSYTDPLVKGKTQDEESRTHSLLTLHEWVCVAHLCSSLYCVALFVLDSSSCVLLFTSGSV